MNAPPRVSVGIPVYNGEPYLSDTLDALRKQELDDLEVIISDNASTDNTEQICRNVAAADSRFHYYRSDTNRGISWNYNRVLSLARAAAFMWNCADDIADPEHLSECCEALDRNPDAHVAFARVRLIDSSGAQIGELDDDGLSFDLVEPARRVERYFARHAYQIVGFGGVFRTSSLRELGGLPSFYGGDVLLGMRLAMLGGLVQVPQQLFRQRRHDLQMNKLQGGDPVAQQLAYAPSRRLHSAFPQWRLNAEMFRAIAATSLPPTDRRAVGAAIVRGWTVPNWRFFPYDIKRNLIRLTRGRYRGEFHS